MNATYTIEKTGRNFVVRTDIEGDIAATFKTKALAQAFIADSEAKDAAAAATTAAQSATTQEQPVTETTDDAQETPQDDQATLAPEHDSANVNEDTPADEAAPETDPAKVARSQKLRDAMNAVLVKVRAGEYNPEESHPSLLTKRGLAVQFADQEAPSDSLPAVLYSRTIDSFSDKSRVEGVTLDGEPVPAARTKGTWAGITRSFLWIEAPVLAFPPSMVGATKKSTVTFHILVDNDSYDNLENAAVFTVADPEPVAAPATTTAPSTEVAAAAAEAGVKPAKRGKKAAQAEQTAE